MTTFVYYPKYAKELVIHYHYVYNDPVEVEISDLNFILVDMSDWLKNSLLDKHEDEWMEEILKLREEV